MVSCASSLSGASARRSVTRLAAPRCARPYRRRHRLPLTRGLNVFSYFRLVLAESLTRDAVIASGIRKFRAKGSCARARDAKPGPYTHDMAKKTITILTDDLDGEELPAGSRSTRFSLDGVQYEIDLSAANARVLADALAPYIAAARRVGGGRVASASRSRRGTGADAERLAAIRAWAQSNGYTVGDRGRIKA